MDRLGARRRKKVVLVTFCKFWRHGAGFWARTRELVRYLEQHTDLTVVYTAPFSQADGAQLKSFDASFRFTALGGDAKLTETQCTTALRTFCARWGAADTYIIDWTNLSFLLDSLPVSSYRLVGTHDLISRRAARMREYNVAVGTTLSEQQEIEILRAYDGVICIQVEDQRTVSGWIANVDGLNWFLDEVWQALDLPGISLDIYGRIDQEFRACVVPGVQFHGFVASLADIYASVDIVINPVRFGAGLKIKTVEAMAAGRPLVTSAEGARGLTEFDKKAFLIAEDASAFRDALARLIDSELLRQTLRDTALAYVQKNLSPDGCFADLLARIDAH